MYVYSVNYCTVQFRQILLAQEASYEMSSLIAKHFFFKAKSGPLLLLLINILLCIYSVKFNCIESFAEILGCIDPE